MTGNARPLRIGVVPFLDGAGGGIYQYSTTMLDGLLAIEPRPDLILFCDRRDESNSEVWRGRGYRVMSLWPSTARWKAGRAVGRIAGSFGKRPSGLTPRDRVKVNSALGEWLSRSGVDLLIFTSPTTVALDAGLPYVMAVHDLQHRLHPEFPEVSADGEWEFREYLFRNGVERALTILVDSEVGREDVLDIYGDLVPPERVRVLPFLPAASPDLAFAAEASPAVRERLGVPDRYLLFPAQFWPHKNHLRVVRAIAQLRSNRGVDVPVVMCGSAGGALRSSVLDAVRRTAVEEGVGDLVTILGYVDDDLMAPLYAGSRGVLLPTFFGPTNIPVLEAWAFGVPLLTSDLRGIREQVGDAAILVDPDSVAAIAEGIRVLWTDEPRRNELVSAGTKRLAEYGLADYLVRLSSIVEDAGRRARRAAEAPIELVEPVESAATSPASPAEPVEPAEPAATSLEPGPTVSVIIPAHNRAGVIAAALESVRNQSFSALEVIVVDDCSTDDTAEVVRSVARDDPRISLLVHPQNRGAQAARNTGIRAARGEWIAFLDSDDRYYPDSIATRLEAAKWTGLDVVHSPCDAVGPDGDTPFPIPPVEGDVYRALLTAPAPMFQGMLVKRELLHRIGLLSESVPAYQEWDTSIRLAAFARFGFVPKPTFVYDLRTSGAISRDSRRAADGYEHVVSAHWREVVRVAGPRTLASHYRIAAELRARAGDRRGAVRCAALSWLISPLSPRRALRLVRRIANSGRRNNGPAPAADA